MWKWVASVPFVQLFLNKYPSLRNLTTHIAITQISTYLDSTYLPLYPHKLAFFSTVFLNTIDFISKKVLMVWGVGYAEQVLSYIIPTPLILTEKISILVQHHGVQVWYQVQHAYQIIQVKKCFAIKKFGPWTVLRVSKNKNTVWTVNDVVFWPIMSCHQCHIVLNISIWRKV